LQAVRGDVDRGSAIKESVKQILSGILPHHG